MESTVGIQGNYDQIEELFISTISSIALYKSYCIYSSGSYIHIIDINKGSEEDLKYRKTLLKINVFDSIKQVEKVKILHGNETSFKVLAFAERWIKVFNIDAEQWNAHCLFDNRNFLDKIYDVILPTNRDLYIGYAHNYVDKIIFNDEISETSEDWPEFQRGGKVICSDECILFQLTFLPLQQWNSKQYLAASATMFGSVCIWNYFIDTSQEINENFSEMREVLMEFKGHAGVIFNLRWINEQSICTTSGDRVVKVWQLTEENDPQPEEIICRNTAGISDIEQGLDFNQEVMKFEGQIGRSLWCVSANGDLNCIVTGGANTSIKVWSFNSESEEEKKEESSGIQKFECNINDSLNTLPFEITENEKYFVRSIAHCSIENIYYVFASTNIGTIYKWSNEQVDETEPIKNFELKYTHSRIEDPSIKSKDFSIIDICCSHFTFVTEEITKETILLVAAFEGNYEKQSKAQILMFDRDNNCESMSPTEGSIQILPFEWMKILPTFKETIDPIECESSLPDKPSKDSKDSVHWKTIRVIVLRKFTTEINIQIGECKALFDLLTTDGRGLTKIWRVYIFRNEQHIYEYKVRQVAEYQLQKKSQVFSATLTHPTIGKLLLGDTKGNIHVCNNYPWELDASDFADFNKEDMIQQDCDYYLNKVHGVDKITSFGHMNNSKHDIISTAKQKHIKVLRYFEEDDKFSVISSLKPGPLSCVLGVYSAGAKPIVVGGRGVMLYLWNLLDKHQLFSINCKGWNRHILFNVNDELSKFFVCFSNKNIISVYYSDSATKKGGIECETLRPSLHERETLTTAVFSNPFTNSLYVATGGEDTEILIAEVLSDYLDLQKSLNYHTSSIRVIKKILKSKTEDNHKYYVVSGGGQLLVNLFEIELSAQGLEVIHLSKYEGLKSSQDFRIMDIEILATQENVICFIASSSGEYHCIQANTSDYEFSKVSTLAFDTALLCLKAFPIEDQTYGVIVGTNKGKMMALRQVTGENIEISTENVTNDLTWQGHQIGINVIDISKDFICTGSDDQSLKLTKLEIIDEKISIQEVYASYSHHSSIKALRFFSLLYKGCETTFLVSSSYDQRGCIWALKSHKLVPVYTFKHTLPDIFDSQVHVISEEEDRSEFFIIFVGKGVFIKKIVFS
ncbi:unnamed protein product [Moneuplotes crassus]|uniref:WD repeat-containing protein 6 n=1 Tax=Euplotes crassus TaxID=5936 RepID=A0AAD1U7J5_EUPCR|nr:unnamed protein product [Moneuplotes crassus]